MFLISFGDDFAKPLVLPRRDDALADKGAAEGFNDWRGRGYDDSSPERSLKRPLPGMRLHDPRHGRQACPKFIAFDQGVGQICPR